MESNTDQGNFILSEGTNSHTEKTPLQDSKLNNQRKMRDRKLIQLFWLNRHETITYCLVFWAFGMCVSLLGPTLLDLGCKTSNMFSTMSWAFFSQSLCTLLGSATGGVLVQRYGVHPILLISCSMLAFTLSVTALCNQLFLLALVLAVMGYFMGTIDTVANLAMLALYGSNVAPFLQALHFFYGLGAFISPLISMPFLSSDGCADYKHSAGLPFSAARLEKKSNGSGLATINPLETTTAPPISHIQYAFWIMAFLQIPVILLVTSLIAKDFSTREKENMVAVNEHQIAGQGLKPIRAFPADVLVSPYSEHSDRPLVTPLQVSLITGLTALLLFLYDGLQASFGGYVYSYAVKSMAYLSTPKAAYLTACFWGTFAFGRLVSIWLATRLTPVFMLFCNISGCVLAMLLMVCMPHSHVVLYMGTCMFGMFLSSVYPTAISLADTYIKLTSPITTVVVVSAAAGEMSMPVIVGHDFEFLGPMSFLVTGLVVTMMSVVVFIALHVTGSSILRPTASRDVFSLLTDCIPRPGRPDEETSVLMQHQVQYYSRMRSDLSETSLEQLQDYPDKSLQETSFTVQSNFGT